MWAWFFGSLGRTKLGASAPNTHGLGAGATLMMLIVKALALTVLSYLLPLAVMVLGSAGLLAEPPRMIFDPYLPIRDASLLPCCLHQGRD